MKDYVRIQSNQTIMVTGGLYYKDVTNKDAHIPDRLKVNPEWPRLTVLIKQGAHWYPSEIAEWATVKALAKDKILTIGEMSDLVDDDNAEEVKATKDTVISETKAITGTTTGTIKDVKLDDVADK